MKTIQMTLDEDLIRAVDKVVKKLHTTRSAFARVALREALKKIQIAHLEEKHYQGYQKLPVKKNEFSIWESEEKWRD